MTLATKRIATDNSVNATLASCPKTTLFALL